MRKRIESQNPAMPVKDCSAETGGWLNLEEEAEVEVSSEDPEHPVESAFSDGPLRGWLAGVPGRQSIRIIFDSPKRLKLLRLVFTEEEQARTQEFALRWSDAVGGAYKEILRQQYNFSAGSKEIENYALDLDNVKVLELEIQPSISEGGIRASLAELRLR